MRLQQAQVHLEQHGRDFGPPKDRSDSETEIRRRMEAFGSQATQVFDYVEAIVFAHAD